jgi:hypothetical protein
MESELHQNIILSNENKKEMIITKMHTLNYSENISHINNIILESNESLNDSETQFESTSFSSLYSKNPPSNLKIHSCHTSKSVEDDNSQNSPVFRESEESNQKNQNVTLIKTSPMNIILMKKEFSIQEEESGTESLIDSVESADNIKTLRNHHKKSKFFTMKPIHCEDDLCLNKNIGFKTLCKKFSDENLLQKKELIKIDSKDNSENYIDMNQKSFKH